MLTPADRGWGNPYTLTSADMVRYDIADQIPGPERWVRVRNVHVGYLAARLVARLVAAGWPGPNQFTWGYDDRLKRWAQAAGQHWGTAPLGSVSEHAWGTALDFSTDVNPMLPARPVVPWDHTDMPYAVADIAAEHGFAWGGSWDQPFDPQHFELTDSPSQVRERADRFRNEEAFMSALSDTEQRTLFDTVRALARVQSPMAQRVADIERRQLAFNSQEQVRDAADEARDVELAAGLAELDRLLTSAPAPAVGGGRPDVGQ